MMCASNQIFVIKEHKMGNEIRRPQMRLLVTDYCDSKCVYCRPSGEGNLRSRHQLMDYKTAKAVASIYKANGGEEIKITGGDPVFWPYLSEYIRYLKRDLCFSKVELITRSTMILDLIDELVSSDLDVLNFSLDTTSEERYKLITHKNDFSAYIEAIKFCATKIYCKINTVVLNPNDWKDVMNFCRRNNIQQLKLLDFIDDISINDELKSLFVAYSFDALNKELRSLAIKEETVFQGGLGHPMSRFIMDEKFCVISKDSNRGSWYSSCCQDCVNYPCHDALMALRVTPDNSFQLCLLNENKHWYFTDNKDMEEQMLNILTIYQNAYFTGESINENDCVDSSGN